MSALTKKRLSDLTDEIEKLNGNVTNSKPKVKKEEIAKLDCIISVGYKSNNLHHVIEKVFELLKLPCVDLQPSMVIYGGVYYNELATIPVIYKRPDFELHKWYKSRANSNYNVDINDAYVNNDNTCIIVCFSLFGEQVQLVALNTKGLTTGVQKRQIHDPKIYKCIKFDEPVKICVETYIDNGFKFKHDKYSSWSIHSYH